MATIDQRLPLPPAVANERLIAVLRAPDSTHLVDVALVLQEEGVTCIEVTLTTAGALEALRTLRSTLKDTSELGAGSVLTVPDLEDAYSCGATYTLAPSFDPDVQLRAHELKIPHIPGAATPTEALTAWQAGAAAVKIFPAAQLGGPAYIKALRGPLPDVAFVPTGGVRAEDVEPYLRVGAVAVGVGGPLIGDALLNGPDDAFRDRVRQFVRDVRNDN